MNLVCGSKHGISVSNVHLLQTLGSIKNKCVIMIRLFKTLYDGCIPRRVRWNQGRWYAHFLKTKLGILSIKLEEP